MQQNLCNGAVSARGLCRPASRCSNHTTTRQHPRAPAAVPQPADQHNWSPAAACAAAHRAQLTPTTRCTVQRRRGGIVAACVATDAAQHDHGKQLEQQEQEAASSSSEGSSSGSESSGSSSSPLAGPAVVIKVLSEVHELEAVAKLRAEAYYAVSRAGGAGGAAGRGHWVWRNAERACCVRDAGRGSSAIPAVPPWLHAPTCTQCMCHHPHHHHCTTTTATTTTTTTTTG
jgi:hypothetical protein